jgi:uncharacterized protein YbcI
MAVTRSTDPGAIRAAVSSEIVRLYATYYGRGPTRARTYLGRDFVLCVLEDLLTPAERTLLANNRPEQVRSTRLVFQDVMRTEFVAVVERATGRQVRAFLSQNCTEPELAAELFLLEPEAAHADGAGEALD